MNLYTDLRRRQAEEINAFLNACAFFAFSDLQFKEGLAALRIPEDQAPNRLYSIGGGGYILKEKYADYKSLSEKLHKERQAAQSNPETGRLYIYQMFKSELVNHEYTYTGDTEETLDTLGINSTDLDKNPVLREELEKACRDLLREEIG